MSVQNFMAVHQTERYFSQGQRWTDSSFLHLQFNLSHYFFTCTQNRVGDSLYKTYKKYIKKQNLKLHDFYTKSTNSALYCPCFLSIVLYFYEHLQSSTVAKSLIYTVFLRTAKHILPVLKSFMVNSSACVSCKTLLKSR